MVVSGSRPDLDILVPEYDNEYIYVIAEMEDYSLLFLVNFIRKEAMRNVLRTQR